MHEQSRIPERFQNLYKRLRSKKLPYKLIFLIIGLSSTLWFLIRVIPKPSRAAYPCQRAAFPIASAFVLWLLGSFASIGLYLSSLTDNQTIAAVSTFGALLMLWIIEWQGAKQTVFHYLSILAHHQPLLEVRPVRGVEERPGGEAARGQRPVVEPALQGAGGGEETDPRARLEVAGERRSALADHVDDRQSGGPPQVREVVMGGVAGNDHEVRPGDDLAGHGPRLEPPQAAHERRQRRRRGIHGQYTNASPLRWKALL